MAEARARVLAGAGSLIAVIGVAAPAVATEPVLVPDSAFAHADEERSRPDPMAVRGGALLFSVAYAPMLGVAAATEFERPYGWWAVPVVGPFVSIPEADMPWPLLADGLAQAAGLSILAVGFVHPRRNLGPAAHRRPAPLALRPAAAVGRGGSYVGVSGTF